MPNTPRPLARIADRHDDYGETVRLVIADGRVTPDECLQLMNGHQEIAGMLSVQDTMDAAGDCLRRNGYNSDEVQRWLRRAAQAAALEATGWGLIEGSGGESDAAA